MEVLVLVGRMAVVFALLAAVLYVLKRSDSVRARPRLGGLQVVSSTRLGKAATLSVVTVEGRKLVLGVTASGVSVLAELPEDEDPASNEPSTQTTASIPFPRVAPDSKPSFAALLAAQVQKPTGRTSSSLPPVTPPTPAEFLRNVWSSARRRPLETAEVSPDAVAAALALASGTAATTGATSSTTDTPETPSTAAPTSADGSATTRARATRRPAPRTDAQRLEEKRPWSRVCRTPSRTPERNAALV